MKHSEPMSELLRIPKIDVQVVDHCNMTCQGCDHGSPYVRKTTFEASAYRSGLDALAQHARADAIYLVGGEPFLHPSLNEFVAEIVQTPLSEYFHLFSNGFWLRTRNWERWRPTFEAVQRLTVSLHQELLDRMTRDEVEEALLELAKQYPDLHVELTTEGEFAVPSFHAEHVPRSVCANYLCIQLSPNDALDHCALAAYGPRFPGVSQPFLQAAEDDRFDILSMTRDELEQWLKTPSTACGWCAYGQEKIVHIEGVPKHYVEHDFSAAASMLVQLEGLRRG